MMFSFLINCLAIFSGSGFWFLLKNSQYSADEIDLGDSIWVGQWGVVVSLSKIVHVTCLKNTHLNKWVTKKVACQPRNIKKEEKHKYILTCFYKHIESSWNSIVSLFLFGLNKSLCLQHQALRNRHNFSTTQSFWEGSEEHQTSGDSKLTLKGLH